MYYYYYITPNAVLFNFSSCSSPSTLDTCVHKHTRYMKIAWLLFNGQDKCGSLNTFDQRCFTLFLLNDEWL